MKELQLSRISKAFGKAVAVSDLTLEVDSGHFFTLLGPSGCGKTTTLRIIAGLTKPDSGDLYIHGSDSTHKAPYLRNLGVVFQNYALFPHLTVFDNVAFGLKVRKVPSEEIRRSVDEVLNLANLSGLQDRFPKELSGGQQQRVAVARAIVIKPSILLLDEPLSNLDLKVRVSMRREIRNLTRRLGITTLNVTHDQAEALSMSDRIGVMDKGRLVQEGSPKEIYEHPASQFVASFIGETNFLTGTVSDIEAGYALIRVGDSSIRTKVETQANGIKSNSSITFSVRPERIFISRSKNNTNATNDNIFSSRVEDVEYFGSLIRYALKVGEAKWTCEVSNDKSSVFEVGDEVYLRFSPEDCIVSYQE